MRRVVVGSDALIASPAFTGLDEEAAECDDPPTVTVWSAVEGDYLPTVTATEHESLTGVYEVVLTADDHLGQIDHLTVVWSGEVDGQTASRTEFVEVAGAAYETIPNLRTLALLDDTAMFPTDRLRFFRDKFEQLAETARGVAYVHRVAVDTFTVGARTDLRLTHRRPVELLRLSVDGIDQDLEQFAFDPVTGLLAGWFADGAVVEVVYSHGYEAPPAALVQACRDYVGACARADVSNIERNVSSYTNAATGETFRYSTADPRFGRWTGLEDVDAAINLVDDERVVYGR